jgi:hypothetical protein
MGDKPAVVLGIGKFIQAIAGLPGHRLRDLPRGEGGEPHEAGGAARAGRADPDRAASSPRSGTSCARAASLIRPGGRRPRRRGGAARPAPETRRMKIATVDAVPLGIPWKATDPPSPGRRGSGSRSWSASHRRGPGGLGRGVRARRADGGLRRGREALDAVLVGEPPPTSSDSWTGCHRHTLLFGRRGLGMFAISGVELALWDLAGSCAACPCTSVLGGLAQPRIPRTRAWRGSTTPPTWPGPPRRRSRRDSAA